MTRTRLMLTLLAAAVCGCAPKAKMTHAPVGDLAPGTFETVWTADAKATSPDAFYLVDNLLFLYKGNQVTAYDINGGLKFRTSVGEPGDIVGVPMVQPKRIIFPTTGAMDICNAEGSRVKAIKLSQPLRSPGVLIGDNVYCGTDSETGGRLASINITKDYDNYNWTFLFGIINQKPALFDNALFVATEDGRVISVNTDHIPLWIKGPEMEDGIFHTDGKIIAAIKADEGGVFVPSTDTKLYCLAPNTGRIRWVYYAGTPLTTSPFVSADMVYQYVEGQGIVGLTKKATDRQALPKWTYPAGKQVVADDARYVYVFTDNGAVAAVTKADGKEAFRTRRTDIAQVVVSNDPKNPAVYGLVKTGELVCIKPVLTPGKVGELAMLTP